MRISDPDLLPLRLKRVEARFDGCIWERLLVALPKELRSILAAGIQDVVPMNDAIKQAVGKGDCVEGATVARGHHIRVV